MKIRFDRIPLRFKLVSSVVAVLVPIALFVFFYYPFRQHRLELATLKQETQTLAQLVSMGVGIAMRAEDYSGAMEAMNWVKQDSSVQYVVVTDAEGRPFATYNPSRLSLAFAALGDSSQVREVDGTLRASTPILSGGKQTGTLFLGVSVSQLSARMRVEQEVGLLVSLGILIFGSGLALFFAKRIARPVGELRRAADRIAAGDYDVQVETTRLDEVGALGQAFNTMTGQIRTAFQQLADQAVELEKARDAALTAASSKAEFLATMSHEIRTPMNGVLGMLDLALEGEMHDEERKRVRVAHQSAEALLHILNDILDVSRIESGKMTLETIDFDLTSVVNEVSLLLRPQAEAKGLDLRVLVRSGVPDALRGDPARLRQILTNLIGNAIKFTSEGEVVVRVAMVGEEGDQLCLRFEVSDTGIGISEDALARLFQPFSQADASTTRRFGGTGLGLTISKRLVELMDGNIDVQSIAGQGSTFRFSVPFGRSSLQSARTTGEAPFHGRRALLLDDEPVGRTTLAAQLARWGFSVVDVETGAEARRALLGASAEYPFDLAIFDFQLPGADGITIARELKADSALVLPPFVLLSSAPRRGQARASREAGFSAYLPKPVDPAGMLDCLTGVFRESARATARPAELSGRGAEPAAGSGLRILLAEDNEVNQQIAVTVLQRLGHRVDVAADGVLAVAAVERESYDLVLMDCQMPSLDGFEATRRIRQEETPGRRIPIVAMTANAMPGDRERCLSAGMDDYLAKPINRVKLAEMMARWTPQPGSVLEAPAPIEAPAQTEWIELAQLESLVGDDPADLKRYLRLFLSSGGKLVVDIGMAVERRDADRLHNLTHTLRGSAGSVGASQTALAAVRIDAAVHLNDWDEAGRQNAELQVAFAGAGEFVKARYPAG